MPRVSARLAGAFATAAFVLAFAMQLVFSDRQSAAPAERPRAEASAPIAVRLGKAARLPVAPAATDRKSRRVRRRPAKPAPVVLRSRGPSTVAAARPQRVPASAQPVRQAPQPVSPPSQQPAAPSPTSQPPAPDTDAPAQRFDESGSGEFDLSGEP